MRADNLREALGLLLPTTEDRYMSAEHDQIWLPGAPPDDVGEEMTAKLDALGVFWDDGVDSWSCFT